MANYQIILKILWLKKHNFKINWKMHNFEFDGYKCVITFEF